jgi:adenylosuccinate lyase
VINRYSSSQMQELWSLQAKFDVWKEIEIAACQFWHKQGKINDDDLAAIESKASFSVERVLEIESETHHDVIAFLTNMAENIGPASRHVHFGLTSSDIVDTGLSVLCIESLNLIEIAFSAFLESLKKKAVLYKDQIAVGRTHGIHAEPTTLGLKLLGFHAESSRNLVRLKTAKDAISYGKISGAVGTYSQLPPELEQFVLEKIKLKAEPVSTQVVPRDRHAELLNALALTANGLARLAQEIRLLQKSESREVEEPFQKGQKGSSAMPHKRNPILCERVCGLARVLSGYAQTGLQNIGLWHERDISHSGAERVILPDATSLLEYMLQKMTFVIENLHVYPENLDRVLNQTGGLLYSSRALLRVTEELSCTREDAYAIIQSEAMAVWASHGKENLRERLEQRDDLKSMKASDWDLVFNPADFLVHVDHIFDRYPY